MIKESHRRQVVWFTAGEELQILNWLDKEINVALSPNMAIRYLCMRALQDSSLRARATERINLMFEELSAKPNGSRPCCEKCSFSAYPGERLNSHRTECEKYQALVKERMNKLIREVPVPKP